MADLEEPTPREVLIALNAHIDSCAFFQKINLGFIAAVLAVLVTFAGYTYAQNQGFQERQLEALQKTTTAADQTRAVAQAVGAPITPPAPR